MPTVLFSATTRRTARLRPCASGRRRRPPRVKPSPKVPTEKAPIATALRHARQPLPAAERLLLLGRQRLAAALLAQRAAGTQTEVEVVEDLGGLVRHAAESIGCSAVAARDPPRLRPARRARARTRRRRGGARRARRAASARTLVVASGDLTHRGRRDQHERAAAFLRALGPPVLAVPGNHDIPYTFPARFTRPLARVRAAVGDDRAGPRVADGSTSSASTRCGPGGTSRAGSRARSSRGARELLGRGAGGALGSSRSTTT